MSIVDFVFFLPELLTHPFRCRNPAEKNQRGFSSERGELGAWGGKNISTVFIVPTDPHKFNDIKELIPGLSVSMHRPAKLVIPAYATF